MLSPRPLLERFFRGMARSKHDGPGLELVHPLERPEPSRAVFQTGPLLERVSQRIRAKGLSERTREAYVLWIRRYLDFHGSKHPGSLGRVDLERWLTHLVVEDGLGAQSQNQAASAVVFMYRELLGQDFGGRNRLVRAKQPKMLPKYATPGEVASVLRQLDGVAKVAAMLMYGSGTRIAETLALRLKDINLTTRELYVRAGKGGKDRTTLIAEAAVPLLREQIRTVERLHARDLEHGGGWAPLPDALHRKDPRAGWDLGWQYLFPASLTTIDSKTGRPGRRHLHESAVQRAIKKAARDSKVARPITAHVLRHCFATEILRSGCDIRLLQRLMGHRDLKTTALYLHILDRPGIGIISPLDRLAATGYQLPESSVQTPPTHRGAPSPAAQQQIADLPHDAKSRTGPAFPVAQPQPNADSEERRQ